MSYIRRLPAIEPVTDAGGNATSYTNACTGRIVAIAYVPDGGTPYDNTLDVTVTVEDTGEQVLQLTNLAAASYWYPRTQIHDARDTNGVGLTLNGTQKAVDFIRIFKSRLKFVIAQGGNVKKGKFHVLVD